MTLDSEIDNLGVALEALRVQGRLRDFDLIDRREWEPIEDQRGEEVKVVVQLQEETLLSYYFLTFLGDRAFKVRATYLEDEEGSGAAREFADEIVRCSGGRRGGV